jgi:hypothetical protein
VVFSVRGLSTRFSRFVPWASTLPGPCVRSGIGKVATSLSAHARLRMRCRLFWQRVRPLAPIAVISALLATLPFSTCLTKMVLGVACPGCGMTRASLRLLVGDVVGSLRYHPVALPGAVGLAVALVLAAALPEHHPYWERYQQNALKFLAVGLTIVWMLRLVGLLPSV